MTGGEAGGAARTALVCEPDGHRRALAIEQVLAVVALETLTPVPTAPSPVRGVTHLHGQIVPVVDLAALLGAGARDVRPGDRLVLVEAGGLRCLLDVGSVLDMREGADAEGAEPVALEALLRECARMAR